MPRFPGVGPRIRQRLIEMGYVRRDGQPDVRRFAMDHRYDKTLFYEWLADRRTPTKELTRLAKDLGIPIPRLLFGDDETKATRKPSGTRPKKSS